MLVSRDNNLAALSRISPLILVAKSVCILFNCLSTAAKRAAGPFGDVGAAGAAAAGDDMVDDEI